MADFTKARAKRWIVQEAPKYDSIQMIDMFLADYDAWPQTGEFPMCDWAEDQLKAILLARRAELEAAA